jgi:hypothetical protein
MLEELQKKLSPMRDVPPLPHGMGAGGSGGAGSADVPQTSDQKLDKIMEMMGKVVVKEDLATLKQDITKETKVMVSEAVDPLKSELHELSTRVKVLEGQGQTSANMISETVATAVDKKFQEMQTKFPQGGPQDSSLVKGEGTVIFSGLGDDLEAATKFIDAEFAKLKLGAPVDSYFKGDEFKGMYYHRYDNLESANAAIKHFERSKLHLAGQRISCRPELPIGHRVCLSTSLGFGASSLTSGASLARTSKWMTPIQC